MPATANIPKQQASFVKLSQANFINATSPIALNDQFIAETIEYANNPYQLGNNMNLAANVLEVNLYNLNQTVTSNDITKVPVSGLVNPIQLAFPASNNQNLTQFLNDYNALSPYRFKDRLKRDQMIVKSGIQCVYWDTTNLVWSSRGCSLANFDTTHVNCQCTHLSAFSVIFVTPVMTVNDPLLENSTIQADVQQVKTIGIADIVRWPLGAYFDNLQQLWQHNRPSIMSFILNPGFIVLVLYWAMYISSVIYYSGRDDLKRY